MTEQSRSSNEPTRQATEDRAIIDHLVKAFHTEPTAAPKSAGPDQDSSRICRQWTPESRAMLMLGTPPTS